MSFPAATPDKCSHLHWTCRDGDPPGYAWCPICESLVPFPVVFRMIADQFRMKLKQERDKKTAAMARLKVLEGGIRKLTRRIRAVESALEDKGLL